MKYAVTLKQLREAKACFSGYNKAVRSIQGKTFSGEDATRETYIRFAHHDEIPLTNIIDSNSIEDAIWCLRVIPDCDRDARLFAVWCARQVEYLMTDQRSKNALDVAERHANGEADDSELAAARAAAWGAAWAARDAARGAAWAAAGDAAGDAAWAAARDAARDAAWDAQKEMFTRMCNGSAPWQAKQEIAA